MKKDFVISVSTGRFKKIRAWNRRRNYYFREVKLDIKIYIAKLIRDRRRKSVLDIKSVKTVLLLRNEGTIGDIVVSTPLIKSLSESGYTVDILLTESSSAAIKYNPYVRHVYEAGDCDSEVFLKAFRHTVTASTMKTLNRNNYDLVIDLCLFDIPVHRMMLLRDINAKSVVGFNKWNCIKHYSKSISFKNGKEHVTQALSLVAHSLGLDFANNPAYELHIPDTIVSEVRKYLTAWEGKCKVVMNAFTGSTERDLSPEQINKIVEEINQQSDDIIMIILDHRRELVIPLPDNVVINPFNSLHHVMELIRNVDLVISPDTSIVHISAVWKKPLIAVYKNVTDNNDLWAPGYKEASQIIVNSRKISDVENVHELIAHEASKRGVFAR